MVVVRSLVAAHRTRLEMTVAVVEGIPVSKSASALKPLARDIRDTHLRRVIALLLLLLRIAPLLRVTLLALIVVVFVTHYCVVVDERQEESFKSVDGAVVTLFKLRNTPPLRQIPV